ncbi:MAG: hypothetical protein ACTS7E_00605 [Arsenophonus sp. NC-CH8-MAG3]
MLFNTSISKSNFLTSFSPSEKKGADLIPLKGLFLEAQRLSYWLHRIAVAKSDIQIRFVVLVDVQCADGSGAIPVALLAISPPSSSLH